MVRPVDYKPKPIDREFLNKPQEYPVTGEHQGHRVYAEGVQRLDGEGNPHPTRLGIHDTQVAVDWEACAADGVCMDVCPVDAFEWAWNPGSKGTDNDRAIDPDNPADGEPWEKFRTAKPDPKNEAACIFCMAGEVQRPTQAIKITSS